MIARLQRHTHTIRHLVGLGPQPTAGQVPVSDGNQGATWGDTTTPAQLAAAVGAIGWGQVAQAEITAPETGVGPTIEDIDGLAVTFTAVAGRRYRVGLFVRGGNPSALGLRQMVWIADGSNNLLQLVADEDNEVAGGFTWTAYGFREVEPGAGSVTYKARGEEGGGTGTFEVSAAATAPCILTVDDIGPA